MDYPLRQLLIYAGKSSQKKSRLNQVISPCGALLLSLLFISQPSISDTPESSTSLFDLSLEELINIKVTTASKHAESSNDAPAFVYVISNQDIETRGYSVLSDVLRDIPGFDTTEIGRTETGTEIAVRGVAGNNKVVLLVNGTRVNSPGAEPLQVRGGISVRHAERIEVVYGPGSTLYGQDAINAVINIITKTGASSDGSEATLVIGSNDYTEIFLSYANEVTVSNNNILVSAFIQHLDSKLADLSKEYPDWWNSEYGGTIAASVGADPPQRWNDGLNINVNLETNSNALSLWYRESSRSCADGAVSTNLYTDDCIWTDNSLVINFSHIDSFNEKTSLYSSLNYRRTEVDPESKYSNLGGSFGNRKYALATGITIDERLELQIRDNFFLRLGFTFEDHDTLIKVTIPEDGFDKNGNIVHQAGEFSYYTIAGDPNSQVVEPRATELHYQNYGGYFEFDYQLNEDLSFVLGLRKDYDDHIETSPTNPRFSAIYQINDAFTAKYIYTEAYAAAAPYFGYVNFITPFAIVTNTNQLDAEETSSHEINLNWRLKNGFTGLSLYQSKQENIIQPETSGFDFNVVAQEVYLDAEGLVPRQLLHSANGGESTSTGFDFYGRYSTRQMMSLWFSYSYVDYETKIGNVVRGLDKISRRNIRLGLTYHLQSNLLITPSVVYRSTPGNFSDLNGLEDEIDTPYWLNLFVSYKPVNKLEFFARIDNLSDNKIALKGSRVPMPQEPRTVRLGFSYRY